MDRCRRIPFMILCFSFALSNAYHLISTNKDKAYEEKKILETVYNL